jgi:1D-myo-inositol 3-kinase
MIDYLVIGHISKDLLPDGDYRLGGTVLYAALTARNLGKQVGLLTRTGVGDAEFDRRLREALPGIEVIKQPGAATTTFENDYDGGHRQQYLHAWAWPLNLKLLPASWRQAAIIHLAPVASEIAAPEAITLLQERAGGTCGITPQGWLREWRDDGGKVFFHRWAEASRVLPLANAIIFSEEDVAAAPEVGDEFIQLTTTAAVTHGKGGAVVYQHGSLVAEQPGFKANEVDPTGAGDVFAAAFLCALHDSGDVATAVRFACAAGAITVEQAGLASVPTRQQVLARLHG